jgi:hypothetical protein
MRDTATQVLFIQSFLIMVLVCPIMFCLIFCLFVSGYLNDLFEFDFPSSTWSDISDFVTGTKPVEKFSCRLIFEGGKLYVFGGANDAGIHHDEGDEPIFVS